MKYEVTSNSTIYHNPTQYQQMNMISGLCPFCGVITGFKTNGSKGEGTTPLKCDNCRKIVIWDYDNNTILPTPKLESLRNLPAEIDRYYQEALNCISAISPNGAATLFRKLIHQVGIHYGVATKNDSNSIMGIVEALQKEGHVNSKLVEALRRVKDLGNDGAHVNENEPDMDQIYTIKDLIDAFLQATVLQDASIEKIDQSRK